VEWGQNNSPWHDPLVLLAPHGRDVGRWTLDKQFKSDSTNLVVVVVVVSAVVVVV